MRLVLRMMGAGPTSRTVSQEPRKIIHVDMDAFYASVEQRDRPELRGLPVVVGGSPRSRGVVCTASYEARKFGIRSAMPSSQAHRRCPDAIFLPPDFERYARVSREIRAIFLRYTHLVEPLSLDEAYLDVTSNLVGASTATEVAEAIRRDIARETELTASAGVAPNKFLAKVASDMRKPNGLTVVPPSDVEAFVRALPVRKVPGVGRVTEQALKQRGIHRCADFLRFGERELIEWFGSPGRWYFRLARGIDHRPVEPGAERKSVSIEDTFPRDLTRREQAEAALWDLCTGLEQRLVRHALAGRTIFLKVKYADFRVVTRRRSCDGAIHDAAECFAIVRSLLDKTDVGARPIRLLGVGVSHLLSARGPCQGTLPFGPPRTDA